MVLQYRVQVVVFCSLYKTVHRPSTGLLTPWPPLFSTCVYIVVVLPSTFRGRGTRRNPPAEQFAHPRLRYDESGAWYCGRVETHTRLVASQS